MTNTEEMVTEEREEGETIQPQDPLAAALPLCDANRSLVVDPTFYSANVVFRVGSLNFIDKAP
jgi:hypothetical protein